MSASSIDAIIFQPVPHPIDDGKYYLMVLPQRDGSEGFYNHVAMVSTPVSLTFIGISDLKKTEGINTRHKH